MLQHPDKYLYIPYVKGGGLDSKLLDLEQRIYAALSMKRIPIFREMETSYIYTLDKDETNDYVDWDRYIDLSKTIILKVDSNGAIKEIPDTLQYVYEKDFNFNLYSKKQIRFIDTTQIYDKENDQYPVICLLKKEDLLSLKGSVDSPEKLEFLGRVAILNPSFFILFPPSEEVNILTDTVLSHFGTTRQDMEFLKSILYHFFPRGRKDYKKIYEKFFYYACMHVRYGAGARDFRIRKDMEELKVVMREALYKSYKKWYGKKLPLYIMSNINIPGYFDSLKSKYDIYRYTDFKELREQFTGKEVIDHNLLYSVEKNIMRHALVKILPEERNPFIFTGPWEHTSEGFNRFYREQLDADKG